MLLVERGFPLPEVNFSLQSPDGREIYRLDLAWPLLRIALEYDGHAAHAGREEQDAARADDLRKRGVTKPVLTPARAADAIRHQPGRAAIVFGPERSGLETEEVALARSIITVPVNPGFASLNLAQAVILCAAAGAAGRARRAHRPFRSAAGASGLLLPGKPRRRHPPHLAHHADEARLEPPGGANAARRAVDAGARSASKVMLYQRPSLHIFQSD